MTPSGGQGESMSYDFAAVAINSIVQFHSAGWPAELSIHFYGHIRSDGETDDIRKEPGFLISKLVKAPSYCQREWDRDHIHEIAYAIYDQSISRPYSDSIKLAKMFRAAVRHFYYWTVTAWLGSEAIIITPRGHYDTKYKNITSDR